MGNSLSILSLNIPQSSSIKLLGYNYQILWEQVQENLIIKVPEKLGESPVYVFKVKPNEA